MRRYAGQRSKKSGMAPGTLMHIGRHRTDSVTVSVMEYNEEYLNEVKLEEPFDYPGGWGKDTVKWINIDGLHEASVLEKLGRGFCDIRRRKREQLLHNNT